MVSLPVDGVCTLRIVPKTYWVRWLTYSSNLTTASWHIGQGTSPAPDGEELLSFLLLALRRLDM